MKNTTKRRSPALSVRVRADIADQIHLLTRYKDITQSDYLKRVIYRGVYEDLKEMGFVVDEYNYKRDETTFY